MDTIIGRYVWSKSGRDKDHLFIIIDIIDDGNVLVADGNLRRVDNPKKKNLKHLKITNQVSEEVSETVLAKKKLNDSDLQKAVLRYNEA
ncbi:MAG TPA: RNA-binding protein [Ruminiclostridium sp.]|nr:RNA-binding protein [Ruminiclostridium sp.]